MWKELLARLNTETEFKNRASSDAIEAAEKALDVRSPEELRSLLQESDGVEGEYGLGLVWPVDRIVRDNLTFRTNVNFRSLYMPFDPLLFFADAGNGDQFAYSVLGGEIRRSDIFVWNHEDDSRTWAAPSLKAYFEWWLSGKLKV